MGSVVDVVSVHAGQGDDPWLLESPIGWGVVQTVLDRATRRQADDVIGGLTETEAYRIVVEEALNTSFAVEWVLGEGQLGEHTQRGTLGQAILQEAAGRRGEGTSSRRVVLAIPSLEAARWWSAPWHARPQVWLGRGGRRPELSPEGPPRPGKPGAVLWTSSAVEGLPCAWWPAVEAQVVGPAHGWSAWDVELAVDAPVFEVRSPADWRLLCDRYPRAVSKGLVEPDWSALAEDFAAVHLTTEGLIRIQGAPIDCDHGLALVWGWDVECTGWLRGRVETSRFLGRVTPSGASSRRRRRPFTWRRAPTEGRLSTAAPARLRSRGRRAGFRGALVMALVLTAACSGSSGRRTASRADYGRPPPSSLTRNLPPRSRPPRSCAWPPRGRKLSRREG